MKCENCGRESAPNRVVCMYCGGKIIETVKREINIQCPNCNTRMKKIEQAGVTLDSCPSCHGVWYDRTELEVLLRKSKEELEQASQEDLSERENNVESTNTGRVFSQSERDDFFRRPAVPQKRSFVPPKRKANRAMYRKCPHCGLVMNRVNYLKKTGIVVDVCRKHGIYLDDGEFDSLHRFIQTLPLL